MAVEQYQKMKVRRLTPRQELFCRYYTQNEALFGNATLSYAEAYGYKLDELPTDDAVYEETEIGEGKTEHKLISPSSYDRAYNTAAVEGGKHLKKPHIQARVTTLLTELLNDTVVDSQLAKVVMQDAKPDAKVAAIREYNKLKQRIVEKTDITSKGEQINIFDESQIARIAGRVLDGQTTSSK